MSDETKEVVVQEDQSKDVYLTGTDGGKDYLVCGNAGGLAFGVRPIIDVHASHLAIGVRIRLCNFDETEEKINVAEYLDTAKLGAFAWTKVDTVRASVVFTVLVPAPPHNISVEEIMSHLDSGGLIPNTVSKIFAEFTVDDMVSPERLSKWIVDTYIGIFTTIKEKVLLFDLDKEGEADVVVPDDAILH